MKIEELTEELLSIIWLFFILYPLLLYLKCYEIIKEKYYILFKIKYEKRISVEGLKYNKRV